MPTSNSISNTLQILLFKYNGRINLSVSDISQSLGLNEQHCRNQISQGIFPVHTYLMGGKRVGRVDDVAEYIDRISSREPAKRRGPRTKAEKIAAAQKEQASHA